MAIKIEDFEERLKSSEYSGFTWYDGGGEKGGRKYTLSGTECAIEVMTPTVRLPITNLTEASYLTIQAIIEKQQMEELLKKIAGDASFDSIKYILSGDCSLTVGAKVHTVDEAMRTIETVQLKRKQLLSYGIKR